MLTPAYNHFGTILYTGNSLDVLKELPSASVQCVVTSPPFYALRNYGTEPQVWGGDANCEHHWNEQRYYVNGGAAAIASNEAFSDAGPENAQRVKDARWRTDSRCTKCTAWFGHLGLEPTLQQFISNLVAVFHELQRV